MIAAREGSSAIAVAFGVTGAMSLVVGMWGLRVDRTGKRKTEDWFGAEGIIMNSRVIQSGSWTSPDRLDLDYRYRVEGVEHSGSALSLSGNFASPRERGSLSALTRRYRPGTPVRVFVNPANAADAVLDRGAPLARARAHGALAASALFVAGAIAALVF